MKQRIGKIATIGLFLIAASVIIVSCKPEQIIDPSDRGVNARDGGALLSGSYSEDITLSGNITYLLSGGVHFEPGSTLTIEPGTVIESDPSVTSQPFCYLMIEKGATILAEGTASDPIIFTSGSMVQTPGDWGGLIINGNAPTNKGVDVESEIAGYPYGGTDANDNSGVLRYVRVEFGGAKIDPETEHNGFTFNGVGNGTTVEYIEAWNGTDDGIEMFGGTVNLKYVVSWNNTDDGFDWTYGWSGMVQHLLIRTGNIGDRGIEADNQSDNNAATPFSDPIISNVTIISSGTQNEDNGNPQGIELRRGTKGQFYNIIVTNFPGSSVRVSDLQTNSNVNDLSLDLDYCMLEGAVEYKFPAEISAGNEFESSADFLTNQVITLTGDNGYVGTYPGGKDVSSVNSFFDPTDYIGAVKSDASWLSSWTVF